MKGMKTLLIVLMLSLLLTGCASPTPTTAPQPIPNVETIVAATFEAASAETAAAPTQPPAVTPTTALPAIDPAELETKLKEAIAARNFNALPALMANPFTIALWQSEGSAVPTEEAVEQLRQNLLRSKTTITFSSELPAGLQPAQPPDVKILKTLLSKGWGMDGLGEALLTLAEGPDGRAAWNSILFANSGFTTPEPASLKGTIMVASANLRSGPGPLHTLVAPYAMGSEFIVSYVAPNGTWGKVTTADGKEGWVLLSLLNFGTDTENTTASPPPASLPRYQDLPSDSIHVFGWVEGGSGQPIDKAFIELWQKEEEGVARPQGITDADGMFHIYLPADSTGNWTIQVASVDCTSSVMDENCEKQSEFVQLSQTIEVPSSGPVVFVYNNIMGDTPAQNVEGCPPAEAGKVPLSNAQDGYCLLYPEGFTIRQPATSVLEIAGPALDQTAEPLAARVNISKKPLPGGSSLETVAGALWSEAQSAFTQNATTIGGEPALYADLMVGETAWKVRQAVVIHADSYYILTFTPYDQADPFGKALPDQQKAWDTIIPSFTFSK